MDSIYALIRALHVPVALAILPLYWVPALTRKGGRVHVVTGRVWFAGMLYVAVTGAAMGALRMVGSDGEVRTSGLFFVYLGSITAVPIAHAWRVVRLRRTPERLQGAADVVLALLPLLLGAALIVLPLAWGTSSPLHAMSLLSIAIAVPMLRYRRRAAAPRAWYFQHLLFAGIGGIAAHTAGAIFVTNMLKLRMHGVLGMLPWVLPSVVGTLAIVIVARRHRRRLAPRPR
jgi:uncharacterized membrane protein